MFLILAHECKAKTTENRNRWEIKCRGMLPFLSLHCDCGFCSCFPFFSIPNNRFKIQFIIFSLDFALSRYANACVRAVSLRETQRTSDSRFPNAHLAHFSRWLVFSPRLNAFRAAFYFENRLARIVCLFVSCVTFYFCPRIWRAFGLLLSAEPSGLLFLFFLPTVLPYCIRFWHL